MGDDGSPTATFFEQSPPMPAYLVAFLVSDFECVGSSLTSLNGSSIPVNVCARPMYKNKTMFALDVAVRVMEYYLTAFDVDYPLPKLGNSEITVNPRAPRLNAKVDSVLIATFAADILTDEPYAVRSIIGFQS